MKDTHYKKQNNYKIRLFVDNKIAKLFTIFNNYESVRQFYEKQHDEK